MRLSSSIGTLSHIVSLIVLISPSQAQESTQSAETNETILVRLRGGDRPTEGRVEILIRGEWGTICDDKWNIEAASVVCKMLGYDGALEYVHSGKFGPGEGPIWMDNVHCTGEEKKISECEFPNWGQHDCSHHEDAGVKCNSRRIASYLVNDNLIVEDLDEIRLRPPRGQRRYLPQLDGYVEVRHKKRWKRVCSTQWSIETASVICGQLGFPGAEKVRNPRAYLAKARKKHSYWLTNVTCLGIENKLSQCEFNLLPRPSSKVCSNGEPLIIQCIPGKNYRRGRRSKKSKKKKGRKNRRLESQTENIRLKAGSQVGDGRLEVKRSGQWGTVCHRGFDLLAANAACRELGFGTAKRELRNSYFGQGHGPIWMTNVKCHGNETKLTDCDYDTVSTESEESACTHSEDIGLSCYTPQFNLMNKIRLVGGRNPMEGRVEVKMKRKWRPVCSDNWTVKDATVVCRQLGLGFTLHALKDVYFFPGSEDATGPVLMGVNCTGNEVGLQYCRRNNSASASCGDPRRTLTPFAGVICTEMSPDLIQDVQLLQQSMHLDDQPLHNLYCASEENCLAPSAADMDWPYGSRRLLRFSTRVWNRGRADFRPARTPEQWIWHQCHGHYHSMAEFTHYDILDLNMTKVAEGHKASFCLEDSECSAGVSPRFDCDQPGGGIQGIAVGCADNYQYNIDCQWIDISDLQKGNYLVRIRVNPGALVPESDFANNEVYCNLQYDGHRVWAWNCHIRDDYDAETIAHYYSASVYP